MQSAAAQALFPGRMSTGERDGGFRYAESVDYQPMSIARLAAFIAAEPDFDVRWRLVVEFLKEYQREPSVRGCWLKRRNPSVTSGGMCSLRASPSTWRCETGRALPRGRHHAA
jgi:hypothetical protein